MLAVLPFRIQRNKMGANAAMYMCEIVFVVHKESTGMRESVKIHQIKTFDEPIIHARLVQISYRV